MEKADPDMSNKALEKALSKICPQGSECNYKLNEEIINQLKHKK